MIILFRCAAGNYGLLGILDYSHDTDAEFQAYKRQQAGMATSLKLC